jgi:hypothetical protein
VSEKRKLRGTEFVMSTYFDRYLSCCTSEMLSYRLLGLRANQPINQLAVLEDQQGWNAANVESSCARGILVDI